MMLDYQTQHLSWWSLKPNENPLELMKYVVEDAPEVILKIQLLRAGTVFKHQIQTSEVDNRTQRQGRIQDLNKTT